MSVTHGRFSRFQRSRIVEREDVLIRDVEKWISEQGTDGKYRTLYCPCGSTVKMASHPAALISLNFSTDLPIVS